MVMRVRDWINFIFQSEFSDYESLDNYSVGLPSPTLTSWLSSLKSRLVNIFVFSKLIDFPSNIFQFLDHNSSFSRIEDIHIRPKTIIFTIRRIFPDIFSVKNQIYHHFQYNLIINLLNYNWN